MRSLPRGVRATIRTRRSSALSTLLTKPFSTRRSTAMPIEPGVRSTIGPILSIWTLHCVCPPVVYAFSSETQELAIGGRNVFRDHSLPKLASSISSRLSAQHGIRDAFVLTEQTSKDL